MDVCDEKSGRFFVIDEWRTSGYTSLHLNPVFWNATVLNKQSTMIIESQKNVFQRVKPITLCQWSK